MLKKYFVRLYFANSLFEKLLFNVYNSSHFAICALTRYLNNLGVYDKLCGPRVERSIAAQSALSNLGYSEDMVIKL